MQKRHLFLEAKRSKRVAARFGEGESSDESSRKGNRKAALRVILFSSAAISVVRSVYGIDEQTDFSSGNTLIRRRGARAFERPIGPVYFAETCRLHEDVGPAGIDERFSI